jgi:hypothetical protein
MEFEAMTSKLDGKRLQRTAHTFVSLSLVPRGDRLSRQLEEAHVTRKEQEQPF